MLPKVLSREAVEQATGLPRSTIYAKIAAGSFPKPIQISGRKRAWPEADIRDWLIARGAREEVPAQNPDIVARIEMLEKAVNNLVEAYHRR